MVREHGRALGPETGASQAVTEAPGALEGQSRRHLHPERDQRCTRSGGKVQASQAAPGMAGKRPRSRGHACGQRHRCLQTPDVGRASQGPWQECCPRRTGGRPARGGGRWAEDGVGGRAGHQAGLLRQKGFPRLLRVQPVSLANSDHETNRADGLGAGLGRTAVKGATGGPGAAAAGLEHVEELNASHGP